MRNRIFFSILILISTTALSAQSIQVAFLQGKAFSVTSNTVTTPIAIGASISSDATIKLEKNSLLELQTSNGQKLTLRNAGAYSVQNLIRKAQTLPPNQVGKALSAGVAAIVGGKTVNQSATAGVRGDAQDGATVEFVDSNAQAYKSSGNSYLKAGKFPEATKQFKLALSAADTKEKPEIHYLLAQAYLLLGDIRNADAEANAVQISGTKPWSDDLLLLKARIDVETFAYEDALSLLSTRAAALKKDTNRASLFHFISGVAYFGVDQNAQAKENLDRVVAIEPGSELGKTASQILKTL